MKGWQLHSAHGELQLYNLLIYVCVQIVDGHCNLPVNADERRYCIGKCYAI
jgi:hypothetical protein